MRSAAQKLAKQSVIVTGKTWTYDNYRGDVMGRYEYAATYFNQHRVVSVFETEDGYKVEFENGVVEVIADPATTPKSVVGSRLQTVDYGDEMTTFIFSNNESFAVGKANYSVTVPHLADAVWPGRDEDDDNLPADPSDERVADGPTGPEEDAS